MATIKNSLTHTRPLSCLASIRTNTPLKSALSTTHTILPNFVSSTVLPKKRVRFALKLDSVEQGPSTPSNRQRSAVSPTKLNNRIVDPWRTNGPLYDAYIEYLEKKDIITPDILETNRPTTPEPEAESSIYTHTFLIRTKSPDITVDSITVSTPTRHLPRILQRTKPVRKPIRKSPSPIVDHYAKQRAQIVTPPRPIQARKAPSSINNKNLTVKRADLALPSIKTLNSNEKVIRPNQPPDSKIVNEYLQSKKLTEIIANPLPGTDNQVNYICGHSILPNFSKISQNPFQSPMTNEPYFFQNHDHDHFQPIIH